MSIDTFTTVTLVGMNLRGLQAGFLLVVFAAAVVLGLRWGLRRRVWSLEVAVVGTMLLLVGVLSLAHFHVLFAMNSGLDFELLVESSSSLSLAEFVSYIGPLDVTLLTLPFIVWPLAHRFGRARNVVLAVFIVVVVACSLGAERVRRIPQAVRTNPIDYTVTSVVGAVFRGPGVYRGMEMDVVSPQHQSIAFVDPDLVGGQIEQQLPSGAQSQAAPTETPWNIVVVILESTGFEYVFDKDVPRLPMPTLRGLADEGWLLTRHFATGNTSPRALFSIFSGLYPAPTAAVFSGRADIALPAWPTFLDDREDNFLVTAGRLKSYFPRAFLENVGFDDMQGLETLELHDIEPRQANGLNEPAVMGVFLERLRAAQEPFLGVYYSFIPHYRYKNYRAEPTVFDKPRGPLQRYYNNLRLLDDQIARLMKVLEETGFDERTVLVILGDHGEAFDQHPGNRTHSKMSFNENYHVPVVLHQPRLFAPRVETAFTSHVDILPTLLDAMGKPFDASRVQGESLFRRPLRRRQIFSIGNEGTYTALTREGIKLQISHPEDACWVYNLEADFGETRKLACDAHRSALTALLKFRRFQPCMLETYNEARKAGGPYPSGQ